MFPIPQTSKALFQILHHTILHSHTEYTISLLFPPLEKLEQSERKGKNEKEEDEDEARCRKEKVVGEEMERKKRSNSTKKGERTRRQNIGEEIGEEFKEDKLKKDEKGKKMEDETGKRMMEKKRENLKKKEEGIILMKTRIFETLLDDGICLFDHVAFGNIVGEKKKYRDGQKLT